MGQVSTADLSPALQPSGWAAAEGRSGRRAASGGDVAETGCAESGRIPYQRPGDLPMGRVSTADLSPVLQPSGWAAAERRAEVGALLSKHYDPSTMVQALWTKHYRPSTADQFTTDQALQTKHY